MKKHSKEFSEKSSIMSHFNELRTRIIKSTICFFIASIISYLLSNKIVYILCLPLIKNNHINFIYTGIADAFSSYLRVSLLGGVFFASPIIVYQIWRFLLPALNLKEKKYLATIVLIAPILFFMGMIFAYFVALPYMWNFFISFDTNSNDFFLKLTPCIAKYLKITTNTLLTFGITFELPILILILKRLNIVNIHSLKSNRKYVFLIIMIISALLTPPDVISMIVLGFPVYFLYEITIILIYKLKS